MNSDGNCFSQNSSAQDRKDCVERRIENKSLSVFVSNIYLDSIQMLSQIKAKYRRILTACQYPQRPHHQHHPEQQVHC